MKGLRFLLAGISLAFSSLSFAAPVDINTATAQELAQALTGIGEKKAQAIVEWRTAHGSFSSVEELTQVKGIGQATVEQNRDNLTLSKVETSTN
ncbi:ComEA family DNA-binding protein [Pokkaliibacter sp. CJK22405]|uniref:ComEA family DNA-binding protein n=1 Tax=Pokkaliibacter sp. CJK22405 TaxID=3384615 RepID=UPI003984B1CC